MDLLICIQDNKKRNLEKQKFSFLQRSLILQKFLPNTLLNFIYVIFINVILQKNQ